MVKSWRYGENSATSDESGITFDLSGTPMDQEWRSSFEGLATSVAVLRQSWPEDLVCEMFEEAARHSPISATPPPITIAPPAPAKPRTRRTKKRPATPPAPPAPALVLAGLGSQALAILQARALRAAHLLDPTFATSSAGLAHVATDLEHAPGEELRSYETKLDVSRAFKVDVVSELRDGIGGPLPCPIYVRFWVVGLAADCKVTGRWDGRVLEPLVAGPAERLLAAREALLADP